MDDTLFRIAESSPEKICPRGIELGKRELAKREGPARQNVSRSILRTSYGQLRGETMLLVP